MKLEIAGRFLDQQRYLDLQHRAKDNVIVENVVLSEDDYYKKLAGAKYSILPYDMKVYEGRTSGVLLESIFVGTIPIAPKRMLEENEVRGIGYDTLQELLESSFFNNIRIEKEENLLIDKNMIKGAIYDWMCGIVNG